MHGKTALFLALLPLIAILAATAGALVATVFVASVILVTIALAAWGRRDGAARVVPLTACLYAPLWVLERAVTVHRAVWARLVRGGCAYGGRLIARGTGLTEAM
jgi:hypothetical protein